MVHVVFAVRSALKHSVFHRLLGPKFRANFLKNRFLSLDVMQRGAGGSGDNVHLTLCVEKSICDSSLRRFQFGKLQFGESMKGKLFIETVRPNCISGSEILICEKLVIFILDIVHVMLNF